jgi:hypothetical protein
MLVFSTQLCELFPISPSLWFNSTPSPVWLSILYTCIHCVRCGGMGFWASDRLTPAVKYLYRSTFLDDDNLNCLLWVYLSTAGSEYTGYPVVEVYLYQHVENKFWLTQLAIQQAARDHICACDVRGCWFKGTVKWQGGMWLWVVSIDRPLNTQVNSLYINCILEYSTVYFNTYIM